MSNPKAGNRIQGKYMLIAVAAALLATSTALTSSCLSLFLVPVSTDLGFDRGAFTLYVSLLTFGALFMSPIWGQLLGKIGLKRSVLLSAVLASVGFFALAFCRSLPAFYAVGIYLGCATPGCTTLPATTLVANWFEDQRGKVTGIVLACMSAGGMVGGFLLPSVIAAIGWQNTYIALAICFFALTVLPTLLFVRGTPMEVGLVPLGHQESAGAVPTGTIALPGVRFGRAMRSPAFYLLFLGVTLMGFPGAFIQHAAAFGTDAGLSPVNAGLLVSIICLGGILFTILVGTCNDKMGPAKTTVVFMAVYAVGCVAMLFVRGFALIAAACVLLSVGMSYIAGMPAILTGSMFGAKDFAAIFGILTPSLALGQVVGVPVMGAIFDATGSYNLAFLVSIGSIVAGVLCVLLCVKASQKLWAETQSGVS